MIKLGGEAGGPGRHHQHLAAAGTKGAYLLVLMIIPLVALAIDRLLFWIQRQLFPYQYGGAGFLHQALRAVDARLGGSQVWFVVRPAARWPDPVPTARARSRKHSPSGDHEPRHPQPEQSAVQLAPRPSAWGKCSNRFRQSRGDSACPRSSSSASVTKTYNAGTPQAFTAIRDVTFVVEDLPGKGEFICVLGPSGCGKSTILRLIAGLDAATSAHQRRSARAGPAGRRPGRRSRHGLPGLHQLRPSHGAGQHHLRAGMPGRAAAASATSSAAQWIEHVGLDVDVRRRQVSARAFGRNAAASGDRPHLDPAARGSSSWTSRSGPSIRRPACTCRTCCSSLWREVEATVFFVTHSIEEAVFLGDRVYVMGHAPGTLLQELEVEPADRPAKADAARAAVPGNRQLHPRPDYKPGEAEVGRVKQEIRNPNVEIRNKFEIRKQAMAENPSTYLKR